MMKILLLASILGSVCFYETKAQIVLEALEAPDSSTQTDPTPDQDPYRHIYRGNALCQGGAGGNSTYHITVNEIDLNHNIIGRYQFQCPDDEFILDCAEEQGIDLPYSDRSGASSSSLARLRYGSVNNQDQSFLDYEDLARGWFLTDTAYACSNIEFDTPMEQYYTDVPY